MMVVPAPRAICPLSFSESRPKTVRVESSTANTKPATANTPTITMREYLRCPCMGVLLLQSGGGGTVRLTPVEFNRLDSRRKKSLSLSVGRASRPQKNLCRCLSGGSAALQPCDNPLILEM